MPLTYGYVKAKVVSDPALRSKRLRHEVQYHLHVTLQWPNGTWDVAVNVGTSDSDDLLKYKLVYDFQHPVIATLTAAQPGDQDLTGQQALPALDFARSDVLASTGRWRDSDVMDGSPTTEPAASLMRLLASARQQNADIYVFGRFYSEGNGIHDVHMNQGSTGQFIHVAGDDSGDHNDVWQDGALLVDLGQPEWALYVAAFDQQLLPTDDLGNPTADAQPIGGGSS